MPPSPKATHGPLPHPDTMQVRLDHPATVVPFQRREAEQRITRNVASDTTPGLGAVGRERLLGSITRTGTLDQTRAVIVVPKHLAKCQIVTPLLELADRRITRSQQRPEPDVLDRGVLQRDPLQPLVDNRGDVIVEQLRADRRTDTTPRTVTRVGHVPVRVDRSRENGPALGAPGDPGEQPVMVSPVVVADALDRVRCVPQLAGDDRRPSLRVTAATRPREHAERRPTLHDPDDGVVRPPLTPGRRRDAVVGEQVGDLPPADAVGAQPEHPLDDLARDRVRFDLPGGGAPVAVGRADDEPAGGVRLVHRGGEVLVSLVALPLGHDQQQPEHRPAHRCRGVDALRHADDARAALVELVDRREATDDGAGEPVKPRDDYSGGYSFFDAVQRRGHAGPVHRPAGAVEVFVDLPDSDTVRLGPSGDRVALSVGRLEAFAGSAADLRDAYVPVHDGAVGVHRRRIVTAVGSWGGPDTDLDSAVAA